MKPPAKKLNAIEVTRSSGRQTVPKIQPHARGATCRTPACDASHAHGEHSSGNANRDSNQPRHVAGSLAPQRTVAMRAGAAGSVKSPHHRGQTPIPLGRGGQQMRAMIQGTTAVDKEPVPNGPRVQAAVLIQKKAVVSTARQPPKAPQAYRPQPLPKVLQTKMPASQSRVEQLSRVSQTVNRATNASASSQSVISRSPSAPAGYRPGLIQRQPSRSPRPRVILLARYYSAKLKDIYSDASGKYKGDDAIYLVNEDKDYGFVTYQYEGNKVIVPHIESLNMPEGSGVSYLLLYLLATKAKADGKTHMGLGTAVFKGAGGHVYQQLGFDTSSAEALSKDLVLLSDIISRANEKMSGRWAAATAFDEVYVKDRRSRKKGETPTLTSFPRIE